MVAPVSGSARPHRAARAEARLHALVDRRLRERGWGPTVTPFVGYGAEGWVRVLARVLLRPPGAPPATDEDGRGWRRFLCASAAEVPVTVRLGGRTHQVTSIRDGYLDVRLRCDLEPGWHTALLATAGTDPVEAPVHVVGPGARLGVVSDIDDTVMVTMLPRPLMALRNAFLVKESARQPVPGMAALYAEILDAEPGAFVVYLSTGAWNTAGALRAFLSRHDYPPGPLLLTDWGPTQTGWFRSGQQHKKMQLSRLFEELPQLRWLLVGDDGQHDPAVYAEAAARQPEKVLGVAIRQLSVTEQLLSHGAPGPKVLPTGAAAASPMRPVTAPDGYGLLAGLRERGLVIGRNSGKGPPEAPSSVSTP